MKPRKLCIVSVVVVLLLFKSTIADTLFFDEFEGNAEIKIQKAGSASVSGNLKPLLTT